MRSCGKYGGDVSRVTTTNSGGILIEPSQPVLELVRHHLVEMESLFRRVSGFHRVKISKLGIVIFKRHHEFRAFCVRIGVPGVNSPGFYIPGRHHHAICLIDEVLPEALEARHIIIHEVAHDLQAQCRHAFRDAWLIEGFAEYCTYAVQKLHDRGSPKNLTRWLIENRCHLSFQDILNLNLGSLAPGRTQGADVDGICLVSTFYMQSCLMVIHMIEVIPEGEKKFAAVLADLRRKRKFLDSFQQHYGLDLDKWEQAWHAWMATEERTRREATVPLETIAALERLSQDEQLPPDTRASYLRSYVSFAQNPSRRILREYADSEGPLRSVARYCLFILGEDIRHARGDP